MQLIRFSLAWGFGLLVVFRVFGDVLPLIFTSDQQVIFVGELENSLGARTCPFCLFLFFGRDFWVRCVIRGAPNVAVAGVCLLCELPNASAPATHYCCFGASCFRALRA